jgi:hypothetical protein
LADDVRYFPKFEKNGNVDLVAKELHEKYAFTHIIYQAEEDIIRAARLRYALALENYFCNDVLVFVR